MRSLSFFALFVFVSFSLPAFAEISDDKIEILDGNYSMIVDYKESGTPGLQVTVNTAGSSVSGSEITDNGNVLTFQGKLKPMSTTKVFVNYDITLRDYQEGDTFVDSGTQGSVLLDLGKPMTVASSGARQFELTVKKK